MTSQPQVLAQVEGDVDHYLNNCIDTKVVKIMIKPKNTNILYKVK